MLKDIAEEIAKSSNSPTVKFFFNTMVDNAAVTQATQGGLTGKAIMKGAGGTATEKIVQNAGRLTRAKAGALSTMKVGALVDGTVYGATMGYTAWQYHKGNIDGKEFRRIAITRGSAVVGSVGMSGAGAFVGTLVFPGIGTFLGGMIGGVMGDYMGCTAGERIDNKLNQLHKEV